MFKSDLHSPIPNSIISDQCCSLSTQRFFLLISFLFFLLCIWFHTPLFSHPVCFCVISSSPASTFSSILPHFSSLCRSAYGHWHAVYYFARYTDIDTEFVQRNDGMTVLYTHQSTQKNIYDAVHHHCTPNAIVILLDYDETLTWDLMAGIEEEFRVNPHCYTMAVGVQINSQTIQPSDRLRAFRRREYLNNIAIRQNRELLQGMQETVRVFRGEMYRSIGHWHLTNQEEQFIGTTLSFIMPMLEMREQRVYVNLRQEYGVQIPRDIYINRSISIVRDHRSTAILSSRDLQVLSSYSAWYPFNSGLIKAFLQHVDLSPKFTPCNKSMIGRFPPIHPQQPIPSIIHQIWLDSDIPQHKHYFMESNRRLHPSFSHRVWSRQDITPLNFPLTYDALIALLAADQLYSFSRLASVSDLMRYEIIYTHGGYYIDFNYMLFQSLEQYNHYSFFIISSEPGLQSIAINNGVFGARPRHPYLKRLLTMVRDVDVCESSNQITGPNFFVKVMSKEESVDKRTKIIPFERGYPFYPWLMDQNMQRNLCTYREGEKVPQEVLSRHPVDIVVKGYRILRDCKQLYPLALGTDFFEFGGSWMHPRRKQ